MAYALSLCYLFAFVIDHEYKTKDNRQTAKIYFIFWWVLGVIVIGIEYHWSMLNGIRGLDSYNVMWCSVFLMMTNQSYHLNNHRTPPNANQNDRITYTQALNRVRQDLAGAVNYDFTETEEVENLLENESF